MPTPHTTPPSAGTPSTPTRRRLRAAFTAAAAALLVAGLGCASTPAFEQLDDVASSGAVAASAQALSAQLEGRQEPAQKAPPAPRDKELVINAVGDCAIGDLAQGAGAEGSFAARLSQVDDPMGYPFSGVLQWFSSDDLTIANLEGVLTSRRKHLNPVFPIRGEPSYANMLVRGGVDIVNLANNHSNDYGLGGAADTKQSLQAAAVGFFGNGRIDSREIRGVRVTNLGYLGGRADIEGQVRREVAKARAEGGVVIASFHWGIEGYYAIHPLQRKLGRAAIDAGADLVIGHHPHVLQGVERYRGRHILYSLGNFVFGANSQPKDMDSMIAQAVFRVRDGAVTARALTLIPVTISSQARQNDFRPVVLKGAERERVLAKVGKMSQALQAGSGG